MKFVDYEWAFYRGTFLLIYMMRVFQLASFLGL